jgi:protein O-mannosyl-transferase
MRAFWVIMERIMGNKSKHKKLPASPKRKNITYVYLILLVILPLILNWKIIRYDFTGFDDKAIISNNYDFLSDFKNVFKAFDKDNFISKEGNAYYRPIQTVTLMIDAQINGEKPYIYHLSNLLYHLLNVIVLFFLLRKLGVRDKIAFFVSLLFSIHPLFTDAIVWVPGRGDLLAGLFCSVSFLSFIYYFSTKNIKHIFLHSLTFLLALYSKEISVFLPFVIIIYYWGVLKDKHEIKVMIPFFIIWSIAVFIFSLVRYSILNNQTILSFKAFLRNLPVIPIFMSKLIIPVGLSPMPIYDLLFTIIGILLFILLCVYLWKLKSGNKSILILGIIWFIGFIIPAMFADISYAKVHSEYLECRAYLPSIGVFIALAILLNMKIKREGMILLIKTGIPILALFTFITYTYSSVFSDVTTFYTSLINSNPRNAFALSQRGCSYLYTRNFDLALNDFDNAIRYGPTYSDSYFNKGVLYNLKDDHINAEKYMSMALKYDTLYKEEASLCEKVYVNLSSEKLNLKKYEEAIALLNAGIRKYPADCSLHNNLGLAYFYVAKYDSAIFEYNKAINAKPKESTYFNNRGMAKYCIKNFSDAINDFNSALELTPDFLDALGNRGMSKFNLNDYAGTIDDLTKVINIKPDVGIVWYYRGLAYSKINKHKEAEDDWAKARKLENKELIVEN